jgi:GNAT superfamily N-acetyltransferase
VYKIKLLDQEHLISDFDCGDEKKNRFLKEFALQNSKGGLGRTYVVFNPAEEFGKIYGYYTISSSSVKFESLPPSKHLPRYPLPAILVGKLAIDKTAQKQGLGTALLFNALKRAATVAEEIGVFLIEIKAVNEKAKNLYVKIGFLEMLDEPMKLYLGIKKVRQLLTELENPKK